MPEPAAKASRNDAAKAILQLLGRSSECADTSDIVRLGLIAYAPLASGEREHVRTLLHAGDWAQAARVRFGTFGEDLLHWVVIGRSARPTILVEILYWHDLFLDDEVHVLRTVSTAEAKDIEQVVCRWTDLR